MCSAPAVVERQLIELMRLGVPVATMGSVADTVVGVDPVVRVSAPVVVVEHDTHEPAVHTANAGHAAPHAPQ